MLVLASASPRRRQLLGLLGVPFEVHPSHADETLDPALAPAFQAEDLSRRKALEVVRRFPDRTILAADTMVVLGEQVLNKPADPEDAVRMLGLLSGNTHTVVTGVSLATPAGGLHTLHETTRVTFAPLAEADIRAYVATGSPMDKAGSYGIQDDRGALFISRIDGCYYNVVGLPLHRIWREWRGLLALLLVLFGLMGAPAGIRAQDAEFQRANGLMEQRDFAAALPILERLVQRHPGSEPVRERYIQCLVELKRYPEAIRHLEGVMGRSRRDTPTAARLGEIQHMAGDTASARRTWDRALEAAGGDLSAYRILGETQVGRNEHRRALELYLAARRRFGAADLFVMEVAEARIRLGQPAEGLREFIAYAEAHPASANTVLRLLLRYDDGDLFDLAIVELEDRGEGIRGAVPAYRVNRDLLLAFLMEQRYFRRAYQTARGYEAYAADGQHPLYTTGLRLRSQGEYALARDAFAWYHDQPRHQRRPDALIDASRTLLQWADDAEEANTATLDFLAATVAQADTFLAVFERDHTGHTREAEALLLRAGIRLDRMPAWAEPAVRAAIDRLGALPQTDGVQAYKAFLEGRLALWQGDFPQARIAFTRVTRLQRTGDFIEQVRYFLGLTDFHAGDFEFATVQLRALERLNTGFYANDAVRLRRWLTLGTTGGDSTAAGLRTFATATWHASRGDTAAALLAYGRIISAPDALQADALLASMALLRHSDPPRARALYESAAPALASHPLAERLLWEYARLTNDRLIYERLLEQFPHGFYSQRIRESLVGS